MTDTFPPSRPALLSQIVADIHDTSSRQALYAALHHKRSTLEPQINAFEARREACPDAPSGPLNGLPITVKDQIAVAGWARGFGLDRPSKRLERTSAPLIARLEQQGAEVTGKTALPPNAMDFQTVNTRRGPTTNPHDPRYTSGGSSGGGAAAVASGMSVLDIGADLGGSLRLPAAWCGVTSLTPTEGALNTAGMLPKDQSLAHFARIGPIAAQVRDLRFIWDVMTDEEAKDIAQPQKVALWTAGSSAPCDGMTLDVWQRLPALLGQTNLAVAPDPMPMLFTAEVYRMTGEIIGHETGALIPALIRWVLRRDRKAARQSPGFLTHVHQGYRRDAGQYADNLSDMDRFRAEALSHWADVDALILPVTGICAFRHLPPTTDRGGVRHYDQTFDTAAGPLGYFDALTRFTLPVTLMGWPVVTLPIGRDGNGLPVGAQVVGKPHAERQVLALARALEKAIAFRGL